MATYPVPVNEKEHLAALNRLQLLDTPIEERFERITRLACRTLQVPMSSFTLIDEGRQWFKTAQGMRGVEYPRDVFFCAHAITGTDVMHVPDAGKDDRFAWISIISS